MVHRDIKEPVRRCLALPGAALMDVQVVVVMGDVRISWASAWSGVGPI